MKTLIGTSALLAAISIALLAFAADPPTVKIPSPSSTLDASQPSLMPTTNPPPKVPSVQELRHKRPVPHGVLQQAAEKAKAAPTQVAASAPGGPVTLRSAQATNAAPAPHTIDPASFNEGFRHGARLMHAAIHRNPDVGDPKALTEAAGNLWNAEQAQRAQQAPK